MKLVINFNGLVSACCVDWGMELIVGDAAKENVVDIWTGERLRQIRRTHLKGDRHTLKQCKECQYVLGLPQRTDLDDIAQDLLKLY